jgi:2-methylcitrate dehydratase PrpD
MSANLKSHFSKTQIHPAMTEFADPTSGKDELFPVAIPDPKSGATKAIAQFVAQAKLSDIPSHGVARLKDFVLDFVGLAAYAGQFSESSAAVRRAIRRLDPNEDGPGTVIGDTRGYTESNAAFLNGSHAHSLEFDDTNRFQTGHPGCVVVAAALAEAERIDATGEAFFEALAVGYEVACRVGQALGVDAYYQGFHMTPLAGIYGAVAVVARLRSLSPEAIANAFGITLSQTSGSLEYLVNGAWNKRLHPGFAASSAILCVTMSEEGVLGASEAFEGPYGLLHAFTPKPRPAALTDRLGKAWVMLETAIKPYPACRLSHGSIDSALQLRGQVSEKDILKAKITIRLPQFSTKIVGVDAPNKKAPDDIVDAQFSVYFAVATVLTDGSLTLDSYNNLKDPARLALMKNTKVIEDDTLPNGGGGVDVTVGGKTYSATVKVPLGEPENWVGEELLRKKFILLAGKVFGEEHAIRIADAITGFGLDSSVRTLMQMARRHQA